MQNDIKVIDSFSWFIVDTSTRIGKLYLEGRLDQEMLRQINRYLTEACKKVDTFKVNIENLTFVDPDSIYLLFYIYQTMKSLKKPIQIDGPYPLIFTNAVKKAGFSQIPWLCFGV